MRRLNGGIVRSCKPHRPVTVAARIHAMKEDWAETTEPLLELIVLAEASSKSLAHLNSWIKTAAGLKTLVSRLQAPLVPQLSRARTHSAGRGLKEPLGFLSRLLAVIYHRRYWSRSPPGQQMDAASGGFLGSGLPVIHHPGWYTVNHEHGRTGLINTRCKRWGCVWIRGWKHYEKRFGQNRDFDMSRKNDGCSDIVKWCQDFLLGGPAPGPLSNAGTAYGINHHKPSNELKEEGSIIHAV